MWDAGTHKVILEVDEFQHQSTPCECEQVRMINVTSSLGMPCLWIRFNPDDYKGGRNVKDTVRKDLLIRVIKAALQSAPASPQDFCRIQHLFFDGFKLGEAIPMEIIPVP